jgi:ATP-dependent RNA helicase SUPV3L1/SUV3
VTSTAGAAEANGFRVTVEMTSLLGCAGEDFASILTSLGYRVRRTPKPVEVTIAAVEGAEAQAIEAALAAPDETAEREVPVEETPLTGEGEPVAETAAPTEEATATDAVPTEAAATETVAAEAAPEEEATPAEPQFDEVWFPAGRRPDNRRHHRQHRAGEQGQERQGNGQPRPRVERQEAGGEGRQGSRPNGKGKPRRFDNDGGKGKSLERPARERRQPAFDPDSPFAALAALRDRKPD